MSIKIERIGSKYNVRLEKEDGKVVFGTINVNKNNAEIENLYLSKSDANPLKSRGSFTAEEADLVSELFNEVYKLIKQQENE